MSEAEEGTVSQRQRSGVQMEPLHSCRAGLDLNNRVGHSSFL